MPHDDRNGVGGCGGGARSAAELWETEGGRRLLQRYVGHSNSVTDIKEAGASLPCAKHPGAVCGAVLAPTVPEPLCPQSHFPPTSIVLSTKHLRSRQAHA